MKGSNYLRYLWTTIWLGAGVLLGSGFIIWFAVTDNLHAGILLLWALAYLAIGGLIGFIFSVPKIMTEGSTTPVVTIDPNQAGNATGKKTTQTIVKATAQENTNLTQISDWLTKILIGAGLVQIKEVPGFIHHVAGIMGSGLLTKPVTNTLETVTMMCAAIILYFLTWGFICGYLVMKLVLTEQFVDSNP